MAGQYPINLMTVMNLADMGFSSQSFRFGSLTMESDKYICIKDQATDGSSQVAVIDMHADNQVTRKPMKAEASLMNTQDNIIALKGKTDSQHGHFIQVFNLTTKEKLGVHQFSESVVFWRWIAPRVLALVTEKSVYHWSVEGGGQPEKMFPRGGKLGEAGTQIISYAVDATPPKWCLLTGISTLDQGRTIDGSMQLYSVERKQQQLLEGHAGAFGDVVIEDGQPPRGLLAFAERKHGQSTSKLHIISRPGSEGTPFKAVQEITYPSEAPTDFPVSMHISDKYGLIFMISKAGFLFLFDMATATPLFRHRLTQDTVFITCYNSQTGGVLAVNRKGQVLSATINEPAVVPYIQSQVPNGASVATSLALRVGLPGCDDVFIQQFNAAFARGDYKAAATIAGKAKSGCLRTPQIINQFKQAPPQPGQPTPILIYFSTLLDSGRLNALESLELVRPVVAQGRRDLIEKWVQQGKLEASEELGDALKPLAADLAQQIYVKCNSSQKIIQTHMERGEFEQIVQYAKKSGYQADYSVLLRNMAQVNPEGCVNFAKQLLDNSPPLIDINQVTDVLVSQGRFREVSSILLDFLKPNKPEYAHLQTKLLEMNLIHNPQLAEAIFQMGNLTHYDRNYVAQLCEKAGLFQRALEHYTDVQDVKRVMLNTHGINAEWLATFFGQLPPETCLECLTDLLKHNRQNLQLVVQASIKYHDKIGTTALIQLFENFNSYEGIFYFVGAILSQSQDPEVHFKYIEAAAKLGHTQEVERVCRESTVYDAQKVKEFLKEAKLPDPRPLIYVCDLHGFVAELAEYLFKNQLMKYIEVYVVRVNPQQAPLVIGTLIDLDCGEDFIKNLLVNVRGACPVQPLVEEIEKRNRLKLLLPWLEARLAEGNQEPALHNALAMIYIDANKDPEAFLKTNAFYDSKVVGAYCEGRDPHLAYTAYKRAWGSCDEELVAVTNKNGLFRLQARYLVERQSQELWQTVLSDVTHRRQVIDQVVSNALPESTNPDEVSATVKAFISAELPNELIELLEKIVLHNSDFSNNRNLQNLLILTAIKADRSRVMDYINRLENYDGPEIAKIALGEQYELFEEAFVIYKKFSLHTDAVDVLLNNMENLERAAEFAARVNESGVWSRLGRAQLGQNQVSEAIESYIKAEDPVDYKEVIDASEREDLYEDLARFLQMARKHKKDSLLDSELIFAFAKNDQLAEMEEFVSGTNTANVQGVGDRLFEEGYYKAAKILFQSIPNNAKLASCFVHLGEFQPALDAAKKANNPKVWKELNSACVAAKEFRYAQVAGMHVIVHPDHLEELIQQYERNGYIEELIALLDAGLGSERAHVGMYTELGILYTKHKPDRLKDFCKTYSNKLNIPKLIRACESSFHWSEAVFLYCQYDEFDQAAQTMMLHSPSAWTHDTFMTVMQKVSNTELYYRAVGFYLDEHPELLNSLLGSVVQKVDHARVVNQMKKAGHLPLIQDFLKSVQQHNIREVNEGLNELFLEAEDFESLRNSIQEFDNHDQIALAQRLEKHELLEMRRVAVLLYKKNKRYKQAIELSKQDQAYQDAMETARDSCKEDLCELLLRFFAEISDKECFCACLHVCYDYVRPDIALEIAWRNGWMDQCMPFMIQILREYTGRVDALDKKVTHKEEEEEKQKSAPNDFNPEYMMGMPNLPGLGGHLALMPPAPGVATGPSPGAFGGAPGAMGASGGAPFGGGPMGGMGGGPMGGGMGGMSGGMPPRPF